MKTNSRRSPANEPGTKTFRTLLVENSPFLLKNLALIMAQEADFTVVGAAIDGRQAVQYALSLGPDLILMDLHLPHLNGAQATQYIKQFLNPPIVFLLTSDDSPNSKMMNNTAGADAFIAKSGDLNAQLKSKLQEWFTSRDRPQHSSNYDDD